MIKIGHVADLQVKNREKNLYIPYKLNLDEIVRLVGENNIDILFLSGDLFEYPIPNDSERKLIYNFLSELTNINTLHHIVLMAGNHDLEKERKKQNINEALESEISIGHNALNVFIDLIANLSQHLRDKFIYINQSKLYKIHCNPEITLVGYSLEDNMNLQEVVSIDDLNICVFHAMLKEYAVEAGLPIRKDIMQSLVSIEEFPENSYIFAGDIHKNLKFVGSKNQKFYYSGSTQQHTHNEGDFVKISNDSYNEYVIGEQKVINVYEFVDKDTVIPSKIKLTDQVKYITLELDITKDFQSVFAMLKSYMESHWQHFGKVQTYIKVKTSNVFASKEREMFTYINSFNKDYIKTDNIRVSFEYDKIIQKLNTTNNEAVKTVIEEVIKEKSNTESDEQTMDLSMTINPDNIDDLILTDTQVVKLFSSVVDEQFKKIKDNEFDDLDANRLKTDIVSLFAEQLNEVQGNNKKYSMVFKKIYCNQFMALGENTIELDNYGITRILGTNGIGKTTLFRMMRWVLTGEVFEGMKSNTVAKNNMIIFNKNNIHSDNVIVKLYIELNNVPVIIERTCSRKWKNNTTDEDKLSINWKDFVSIERDIRFIINPNTEKEKIVIGNNAETNIKLWIGEAVNNILIINQNKIETLLKSSGTELNEMILSFIGVDYLEKLEDNLEYVKDKLAVAKPTISKQDIKATILSLTQTLATKEKELSELSKTEFESQLKQLELDFTENNDKLIKCGDVPNLIEQTKKKKESLKNMIDNFIIKDLISEEIFSEIEPEKPETEINLIQEKIDNTQKEINDINIENLKERYEFYKSALQVQYKETSELFKTAITKCDNDISVTENELENAKKSLISTFTNIQNNLTNVINTKTSDINSIKVDISAKNSKITEINNAINSGICPTCKRPFSDDFEHKKAEYIKEKENLETEIKGLKDREEIVTNEKGLLSVFKTKYDLFIREVLSIKNSDYSSIVTSVDDFKVKSKSENTNEYNLYPEFSNIIEQGYITIIKNCDIIKEIEDKKIKLNNRLDLLTKNYQIILEMDFNVNEFDFGSIDKKLTNGKDYIETYHNYITADGKIKTLQNYINNYKNDIVNINNKYTQALKKYHEKQEEVNKRNENIRKQNATIVEENRKIDIYKHDYETETNNLTKYETNDLPLYEIYCSKIKDIKDKQNDLKTKIAEIDTKTSTLQIDINNYKNSITNYNQKYDDYLKYEINNFVWKIYSKIIKNGFKDIIFEYYRVFLNNTLNDLLDDLNFKLFWDKDSNLFMMSIVNGEVTYVPVNQCSGMETIFNGLALIYTISLLNIKNSLSHIFIDELSGQLSRGDSLTYEARNYQDLFVKILHKFEDKSIFIVDHNIGDMYENVIYEVRTSENGSIYVKLK